MKRLIVAGLSALTLSTVAASHANAELPAVTSATFDQTTVVDATVSPFDLVNLAYQGVLADQGIPANGGLISEYITRNITAEDIVQAGINTNRLSPALANDRAYLRAVENRLNDLRRNGRAS